MFSKNLQQSKTIKGGTVTMTRQWRMPRVQVMGLSIIGQGAAEQVQMLPVEISERRVKELGKEVQMADERRSR